MGSKNLNLNCLILLFYMHIVKSNIFVVHLRMFHSTETVVFKATNEISGNSFKCSLWHH